MSAEDELESPSRGMAYGGDRCVSPCRSPDVMHDTPWCEVKLGPVGTVAHAAGNALRRAVGKPSLAPSAACVPDSVLKNHFGISTDPRVPCVSACDADTGTCEGADGGEQDCMVPTKVLGMLRRFLGEVQADMTQLKAHTQQAVRGLTAAASAAKTRDDRVALGIWYAHMKQAVDRMDRAMQEATQSLIVTPQFGMRRPTDKGVGQIAWHLHRAVATFQTASDAMRGFYAEPTKKGHDAALHHIKVLESRVAAAKEERIDMESSPMEDGVERIFGQWPASLLRFLMSWTGFFVMLSFGVALALSRMQRGDVQVQNIAQLRAMGIEPIARHGDAASWLFQKVKTADGGFTTQFSLRNLVDGSSKAVPTLRRIVLVFCTFMMDGPSSPQGAIATVLRHAWLHRWLMRNVLLGRWARPRPVRASELETRGGRLGAFMRLAGWKLLRLSAYLLLTTLVDSFARFSCQFVNWLGPRDDPNFQSVNILANSDLHWYSHFVPWLGDGSDAEVQAQLAASVAALDSVQPGGSVDEALKGSQEIMGETISAVKTHVKIGTADMGKVATELTDAAVFDPSPLQALKPIEGWSAMTDVAKREALAVTLSTSLSAVGQIPVSIVNNNVPPATPAMVQVALRGSSWEATALQAQASPLHTFGKALVKNVRHMSSAPAGATLNDVSGVDLADAIKTTVAAMSTKDIELTHMSMATNLAARATEDVAASEGATASLLDAASNCAAQVAYVLRPADTTGTSSTALRVVAATVESGATMQAAVQASGKSGGGVFDAAAFLKLLQKGGAEADKALNDVKKDPSQGFFSYLKAFLGTEKTDGFDTPTWCGAMDKLGASQIQTILEGLQTRLPLSAAPIRLDQCTGTYLDLMGSTVGDELSESIKGLLTHMQMLRDVGPRYL